jgi:hypothetical protein
MFVCRVCCLLCMKRPLRRADHSYRGVLQVLCDCLIVSDLETSTTRRPRPHWGCCATENCITISAVYVILITWPALKQFHTPFQNGFSRKCDLVLPISFSLSFSLPYFHPVDAYFCFLIFPSLLSFLSITRFSSYARCDQSSYLSYSIVCRIFLPSLLYVTLLHFSHDRAS